MYNQYNTDTACLLDSILFYALRYPEHLSKILLMKECLSQRVQSSSSTPGLAIWVSSIHIYVIHHFHIPTICPYPIYYFMSHTSNSATDPKIWPDASVFRPERWLENPDAPLFTYGLGYRMCAGSLLANRELYLTFMRLLASFELQASDNVDVHPVSGNDDPSSLVSMPKRYKVTFVPRKGLNEALSVALGSS